MALILIFIAALDVSLHLVTFLSKTGVRTESGPITLTSSGRELKTNTVMGKEISNLMHCSCTQKAPSCSGLQDLTSHGMSNQGNDLGLPCASTDSEGAWTRAGCVTEVALYCIQKKMWLISLWFLRTHYLAHLWLLRFGPQGLGWVLFSPAVLLSLVSKEKLYKFERAHKNASSLQTNPDIKGRHKKGANISESKALTHFCWTLCIARRATSHHGPLR